MGYNTTSMMALLLVAFLLCTSSAFAFTPSTRRRQSTSVLGAARRGAGFGASALDSTIKSSSKKKKGNPNTAPTKPVLYTLDDGPSIEQYLSPRLFENDSAILKGIGEQLRNGEIVAIRDAFRPEFAEAMHEELHGCDSWSRNEDYFNDGYHFRHYNVYDKKDFSPLFVSANEVFDSADTKAFLADLSGRDCSGESVGAPSYYGPGDHSLPHTDHIGQRSVAYIWHLSNQKWKPEWGGALYWAPEPLANAFLHASFNTLVLFSVTPHSAHFVTTVSPRAKEKRLAYNGWWHSSWVPTANDPDLEERLATPLQFTHAQITAVQDMLDDPWAPRIQPPERHEKIAELRTKLMEELYPAARSKPV